MRPRRTTLAGLALLASACALPDLDSLTAGPSAGPDASPGGGGPPSGGTAGNAGDGAGGSAGTGGAGGNLFVNGAFDDGPSRWIRWGDCTVALSSDNPRSAERCLAVTNRSQTWEGAGYTLLNLEPGRSYQVTVWVRADRDSYALELTYKRRCSDDPQTGIFILGITVISTEWTELSGVLNAPECELLESTVLLDGAPVGASYSIDDTSLELLP